MFVRVLGPVVVGPTDDDLHEPPGSVPAAVLAHLALARGRFLSADMLAERIWDDPPDAPRNAVQAAVSRLRRTLPDDVVQTTRAGYRLAVDRVDVDLLHAESEARKAREALGRNDLRTAVSEARAALERFVGRPLAGLESDAADAARTALLDLRAGIVRVLADALAGSGDADDAVAVLGAEVHDRPLDEGLHCSLMRALAASGRPAEALTTYDGLRRRLADELGVDPSPEAAAVFAAILSGDASPEPGRLPDADRGTPTLVSAPREVGVLLTDVVGSAQHWLDHPGLMPELMLVHHAVVAEVVHAHAGHLPPDQGEGDARLAVFGSALDAVEAASRLQQSLAATDWPGGHALSVRMAVNAGSVVEADGNVFGECVIRCARLRGLAHGGQVLLTRAAAELVRGSTADWNVRPIGRVELRDLGDEDVYQLDVVGELTAFPPLRTAIRIPPELDGFVGRDAEVAGIIADLRNRRLVTLTGLGGSGKTRLAMRVARLSAAERAGGVTFVDVSAARTVDDALVTVASAVGSTSGPVGLGGALGDGSLLVLDNLEQVEEAARLVSHVLATTQATVLATSRLATGAAGEHVRSVPPMGGGDARRLLLDRAADAGVTDLPTAAAEEIVQLTGGLPLAIELAAARLRVLDAPALVELLRERLDPLRDASGSRPERQSSIEALLADTWNRTSASEREVLLAVSQSRSGLTAPDVVDVAEIDLVTALDVLARLHDLGLVQVQKSSQGRHVFRVLELVRRWTEDRCGADDIARARAAQSRHLLEVLLRGGERTHLGLDEARSVLLAASDGSTRSLSVDERVRLARFALHHGWWGDAVDLLGPVQRRPEAAGALGLALIRRADGKDVARGRRLLAQAAERGDGDAAAVLGGSWRGEDAAESYRWYLAALEIDPDDAYALGNVLEHEARTVGLDEAVRRRRPAILEARARRSRQAEAAEDLPWSWHDLAKLDLLLGDEVDALHEVLQAVATTVTPVHLASSRRALAAFADLSADASWQRTLALLDTASLANDGSPKTLSHTRIRPATIVLCGASDRSQHDVVMAWLEPLATSLPAGGGTLVSGGTAQGVSALAAALAARSEGWTSFGYLPAELPDGVVPDASYDELRRSDTSSFSLSDALGYWHDLLTAGTDPRDVRVLGIGGGAITALELHLAVVLGARVGASPGADDGQPAPTWRAGVRIVRPDVVELTAFLA